MTLLASKIIDFKLLRAELKQNDCNNNGSQWQRVTRPSFARQPRRRPKSIKSLIQFTDELV